MVKKENIDFWIKNNLNILFVGKHGIGKTSLVKESFDRHNLNWKYFSASTMDPWVDLIGVPKEKTENGVSYLDLVRPRELQEDKVEALFFDEFNRSHKKVRNAVMELIQFKSINGFKFNNLKMVWAAINPEDDEDEEYDVEKLDPAQCDRFQIYVHLPYKPSVSYFTKKFGESVALSAISWWEELDKNFQNEVSPRRLDYALDVKLAGGDIRYVLPKKTNVAKLIKVLKNGPIHKTLESLWETVDYHEAEKFLRIENNYASAIKYILDSQDYIEFFVPCMPKEKIAVLVLKKNIILDHVVSQLDKFEKFKDVIGEILDANVNKKSCTEIDRKIKTYKFDALMYGDGESKTPLFKRDVIFFKPGRNADPSFIKEKTSHLSRNTIDRTSTYKNIEQSIPLPISTDLAIQVLQTFSMIAAKSHKSTIKKMSNFVPIVNYCVKSIASNDLIGSQKSLEKKYKIVEVLYERLFHLGISGLYVERNK